jgi:hypothetical protein
MNEVIEAIDSMHASVRKLKSLGVIRSQKWTADYGEWLVAKLLDCDLAQSRVQEGWDVEIKGRKVQVRTSFIPQKGSRYTRCKTSDEFDELIVVGLTDNMRIGKMYRIDKEQLKPIIRNGKEPRVNWTDLEPYLVNIFDCAPNKGMSQFLAQQD